MRLVLISVYIFINLLMFGMCGYIYIVWSQYWKSKNKYVYITGRHFKSQKPLVEYFEDNIITESTKNHFKPTFPNATQYGLHYLANRRMILEFKRKIIIKLRSVLFDESSITRLQKENPYDVEFDEPMHKHAMIPDKLLCELKQTMKTHVKMLQKQDVRESELESFIATRALFEPSDEFDKCAIVTNSGALNNSYLGSEIDKHDVVLRFNHAPTKGHEADVGSKTTIRILNSQVVTQPEFDFINSELYKNVKLLIWDPMSFKGTIKNWLQSPDYNFFRPFIKYKMNHPSSIAHIVDPHELWKLWMFLQQHTYAKIRMNPPSSGFLGLSLLLPFCSSVNLFEFIPSHRMTDVCHYFSSAIDPSCTTGVWHPLAAEKLLTMQMNSASDETVFNKGFITIKGYSKLNC